MQLWSSTQSMVGEWRPPTVNLKGIADDRKEKP
jgi:hypothetical protein